MPTIVAEQVGIEPAKPTGQRTLANVQVLRAVAAILVVLFHSQAIGSNYGFRAHYLALFENWGWNGVDLFFVISGFIMVYIQRQRRDTPWRFAVNRLFRIGPLYWTLTLVMTALFLLQPKLFNTNGIGWPWVVSSLAFLSQATQHGMPVLFDGWTLEFEMLFYLIFALSLLHRSLGGALVAASLMIVTWAFLFKTWIMFEFLYGVAIGWFYTRIRLNLATTLAILLAGAVLFVWPLFKNFSDIDRAVLYGMPAALIVYACVCSKQVQFGVLTSIGDASYSIYLLQIFTISGYYKLAARMHWPEQASDIYLIGSIAITVVSGWILYTAFERPVERLLRPLKRRFVRH